jgi:hypothetical protein
LVHQPSQEKRNKRFRKWQEYREELDIANNIVLSFSWHDLENGEKVYAAEFEPIIKAKLQEKFEFIPQHALNHEFGEVLNRRS